VAQAIDAAVIAAGIDRTNAVQGLKERKRAKVDKSL
jgi:hypothetical protein